MNRGLSILFVAASLIVLAGCTITVEPFEPVATTVNAVAPSGDPSAVASGALSPGEVVFYRVVVPSSVASASDLIVYDVDVPADDIQNGTGFFSLRLYSTGGSVLASSVSHVGFTSGINAEFSSLSGTAAVFQPQALSVKWQCLGPCIISSAPFERYVRIENISNDTWSYNLYAFGELLSDTNEPGNDSSSGGALIFDFEEGAIETLGDQDYYEVDAPGDLIFESSAAADLGLRAHVTGPGLDQILQPGDTALDVLPGDIVRVYSSTGWAGSPQASGYSLEILP